MKQPDFKALEKSSYISHYPKLKPEAIEELRLMVEDYRKGIENEEVCAGSEVQSMPGSRARTNLWPFWRRKVRNGGSGRTGAGRS